MTQNRVLVTAALALGLLSPAALLAQQSMGAAPDSSAGPTSLAYKGVTLTPIGFFATEALWRQRNETADMGSSFNAIPFNNTANGQLSEFRISARQSRLGLLAEGQLNNTKLTGYWESDFLSSGTTSNSNESNSYTLRLRQIWGQAAFNNGATVSAGQMWSFITTDKSGVSPRGEATPMTIDAQYAVGFDWARQAALRITDQVAKGVWFGISAEEPQAVISSHNTNKNYVSGAAGGSQLNAYSGTYSYDVAPDLIGKIAFEPGFGHYEIKLLGRILRDRMYDSSGAASGGASIGHNDNELAGGVGVGAIWKFQKRVDIGLSGLWGRGIGRYGTSQMPDATVDSTGKLVPLRAAHGLASIEIHATPKLDLYGYAGVEYTDRTALGTNSVTTTTTGTPPVTTTTVNGIGYGSPLFNNTACNTEVAPTTAGVAGAASCTADTRTVQQGDLGFWYRFYKGPVGVFQWGLQYSYTERSIWSATKGGSPKATENMGFTSFRYYLP